MHTAGCPKNNKYSSAYLMRLKSHWIFFYTFDRSESIFLGVGGEEYIPKCACRCAVRCEGIITHTHTHTHTRVEWERVMDHADVGERGEISMVTRGASAGLRK